MLYPLCLQAPGAPGWKRVQESLLIDCINCHLMTCWIGGSDKLVIVWHTCTWTLSSYWSFGQPQPMQLLSLASLRRVLHVQVAPGRLATFCSLQECLWIRLVLGEALALPLTEQASNDHVQTCRDYDWLPTTTREPHLLLPRSTAYTTPPFTLSNERLQAMNIGDSISEGWNPIGQFSKSISKLS